VFAVVVDYGRAMPALKPADLTRRADQRALAGKCVTVVENDKQVRDALCSLLESWHCHPLPTDSSGGAIRAHGSLGRSPDVVIADFHLGSVENGLQAITLLRRAYGTELPALLISADASQDLRRSARQQKCGMMLKPIKPPELRVMMEKLVA
jgi:CheY-like chemotaxis protein